MPRTESSPKFAAGVDGVIHLITRFDPSTAVYITTCGVRLDSRRTEVSHGREPGLICAACAAARRAEQHDGDTA